VQVWTARALKESSPDSVSLQIFAQGMRVHDGALVVKAAMCAPGSHTDAMC
jgi:hypothetical protein